MGMFARPDVVKARLRLYKTMTGLMLNFVVGKFVSFRGFVYAVVVRFSLLFSLVVDQPS
jgi:hypothetical protein